ncbi:hypothetical protein [Kordia sp.]|uniref:hypothetical protein n=1 Tax=Kordia sp. TaxID=1965332 RepID=UPI003B5A7A3C
MIKRDKYSVVTKTGTRYVIQPEHIKRQAVKELESGALTINEAMEKYKLRNKYTLTYWLQNYSSTPEKYKAKPRLSLAKKKQIVRDIEMEILTIKEASQKHNVVKASIRSWLKKYSFDIALESNPKQMPEQQDKNLLKELALAKTKITALETMIDLAEEIFNIPVRKKCGTKQ